MKESLTVLFACIITGVLTAAIITGVRPETKLVSECPAQEIIEKVIERNIVPMPDGWHCDAPDDPYTDILQPDGVWALENVTCWKKVKTIEQWRAENNIH